MIRARLLRTHAAARSSAVLQRLAVISRSLLAMAFVPTAFVKILGHRFTTMDPSTPVGFFFEALYRAGGYWHFIGWAQLIAGVLLLIPRTATLGAVAFFPIALNIFVITVSMDFAGTPILTGLMLLASTFLLCWDYDKLEPVLFAVGESAADRWGGPGSLVERAGFSLGIVSGLVFFFSTRGFVPAPIAIASIVTGLLAAGIVLVAWIREAMNRKPPHIRTATRVS